MPMWLVLVGGIALSGIGLWLIYKKNSRPGLGFTVGFIGAFLIVLFLVNRYMIPEEDAKPSQEIGQVQERNE